MKRKASGFLAFAILLILLVSLPVISSAGSKKSCQHHWELVDTKKPTCTKKGKEYYKCSKCGKEKTKDIDALGHDWAFCTIVRKATCTKDGLKRCVCSRNSKHIDEEPIPAPGHRWSGWTTVRQSTVTEKGLQRRTCSVCKKTDKRELPLLTADWITPPDFTVTDSLLDLFSRAVSGEENMDYVPVCFLALRTLDGTDRCFLALSAGKNSDAHPSYVIVYIHENPSGEVSLINILPLTLDI